MLADHAMVNIGAFLKLRPVAYHTTAATNLLRLQSERAVQSTRHLFKLAGRAGDPLLRKRRRDHEPLQIGPHSVVVRDQRPLSPGAIDFEPGWDLPSLVHLLNGLCFFWPGDDHGPIDYGRKHFQRYADAREDLVVIKIPNRELFALNVGRGPILTRVNSGSARCNAGRKAPRGGSTFRGAAAFDTPPGDVKEIVFEDVAALPDETTWARNISGPWTSL